MFVYVYAWCCQNAWLFFSRKDTTHVIYSLVRTLHMYAMPSCPGSTVCIYASHVASICILDIYIMSCHMVDFYEYTRHVSTLQEHPKSSASGLISELRNRYDESVCVLFCPIIPVLYLDYIWTISGLYLYYICTISILYLYYIWTIPVVCLYYIWTIPVLYLLH